MVLAKRHRSPKKQIGFNSYVPPSNDHELQVDLLEYKHKQPKRVQVTNTEIDGEIIEVDRSWARKLAQVEPYGIIAINPFTKKLHIEPVNGKIGNDDWKPALQQIIEELGKPQVIYTDPDASIQGNELKKWFADNNIENVITRQHAAVAERAIRTIKKMLDDKLDDEM